MNLCTIANKCLRHRFPRVLLLIGAAFLLTFHLSVADSLAAQANLSWAAPTTYTDGTPLSTLAGYKLYMGTASGNYSQNIDVGNATSYTVGNLNDGTTYYFAVTAYDASGGVSGYSNQASLTTSAASSTLYTLTASAGSGGSITPSGSVVVSQGTSQTFTITPASGYKVAGVTVDGASAGAVSSYTFSNVAANHTIAATFASNVTTYSVTASAGTGGSISPAGATTVNSGASQTYTIAPASGYKIAGVTVDGVSVGAVSSYTFSNIAANHTISASFAVNTYAIAASAGTGGSISPAGTATVNSGASQTYTITPAAGYQVAGVTVDGVSAGAVTSYTFSNVAANHTIAASFAASTPTSTSITSSTVWKNQSFASQTGSFSVSFDMVPNAIKIDAVTMLSGVAAAAYTDGAATVRFNTSGTIDARNGNNYAAAVAVPYTAGSTYHVRMTVNVPSHVYDVYVTPPGGAEIKLAAGYAFRTEQATASVLNYLDVYAKTGSHTVKNFALAPQASFAIAASAGTGGSISPAGTATVNSGASQTYTIAPASGYQVSAVSVDGVSVGAVSSYTFSNVGANHTIAATFAASTPISTSITSSTVWKNQSFASKTGSFSVSFDMVPTANKMDGVTMLSDVAAAAYTDGAATVRFNTSGTIDARNGNNYAAAVAVPYTAGSTYHVRMTVNVPSHVYDVYVTPPGGAEIKLTAGYAFRTEQTTASLLNDLALYAKSGSHTVKNFVLAP